MHLKAQHMLRVLFYAASQHFDIIVFNTSNQITSGFSLLDYEIMRNCVSPTASKAN